MSPAVLLIELKIRFQIEELPGVEGYHFVTNLCKSQLRPIEDIFRTNLTLNLSSARNIRKGRTNKYLSLP